jgi:phosphomannomutase
MNDTLVETLSGIRGIYGASLTKEVAQNYARAYGIFLINKNRGKIRVIVGGDTRKSTSILADIFIKEFSRQGFEVINVGTATTPMIELGVREYRAQGGVIITASHNEPAYNGWKLLQASGAILGVKQADTVIRLARTGNLNVGSNKKSGKIIKRTEDLKNKYVQFILKTIGPKATQQIKRGKYKILVDPNGGAGIVIMNELFEKLGVKVVGVNTRLGQFKRLIVPNKETLAYLTPVMDKQKIALGVGLDCDADRAEMIIGSKSLVARERGNLVNGHEALALAIDAVKPKSAVVINLPTAHLIYQVAKKYGIKVKEVDVGETNVVTEMEKQKSLVGGEGSNGGVIVAPGKCRDGLLMAVLVLKLMAERQQTLEAILAGYPLFFEERTIVKAAENQARLLKRKIREYYKKRGLKIKSALGSTSGLKILFNKNNWLFFRGSKTELGVFRIIANGDDRELVHEMILDGEKIFHKLNT